MTRLDSYLRYHTVHVVRWPSRKRMRKSSNAFVTAHGATKVGGGLTTHIPILLARRGTVRTPYGVTLLVIGAQQCYSKQQQQQQQQHKTTNKNIINININNISYYHSNNQYNNKGRVVYCGPTNPGSFQTALAESILIGRQKSRRKFD